MLSHGSGSAESYRRHHRLKYFLLAAGVVLGLQMLCLEFRVPSIRPELYAENAVDLKVTRTWRYGYVQLWHGAVIVKTRNTDHTAKDIWEPQSFKSEGAVYSVMQREFQDLPWKAACEAALYLVILAYIFFGWDRLKRTPLARRRSRGRLLLTTVFAWTLLWMIAGLPLLIWGYGTPLFTNCVGPGALSSSGVFLGAAPPYSSTVSYHFLLAALAPLFLMLLAPIFFVLNWLPGITEGQVLWLGGLLFSLSIGLTRAMF
jgi:hypothetical protein